MSIEKSDAIVLRSCEWSETSLVVTLWTRGFGKVSAIAKGARRLKSPFESALDLLSISSVVFLMKSGDALDLLTEAKLQRRFKSSQLGLLPLYCGYYAADLIQTLTEHHQPIPGMMELLEHTLMDLDTGQSPASVTLRLELHTMQLLGVLPSLEFCFDCSEPVDATRPSVPFSVPGGGVVCAGCAPKQHSVFRIRTETWSELRRVSESRISDPVATIDRRSRSELRWLMEHVIGHVADRRLRLMDYLEELKR